VCGAAVKAPEGECFSLSARASARWVGGLGRMGDSDGLILPQIEGRVPDGRLAIVNCESKFAEHMAGPVGYVSLVEFGGSSRHPRESYSRSYCVVL
jgi:hypothetical protein